MAVSRHYQEVGPIYLDLLAVFFACPGGAIFLNARSNASPVSSASNSRAFSMKRSFCVFSFGLDLALAMGAYFRVSCPIGQALTDDTTKCTIRTALIVNAKSGTVAVPEIIFGQISVQMIFAAMLVDTLHSALKDREIAFDGVGVDFAATVFADAMTHELMVSELASNFLVVAGFVGHQPCALGNVLTHDRCYSRGSQVINDHGAGFAGVAVHQRQNLVFVFVAVPGWLAFLATDESLIDFNHATIGAERRQVAIGHGLADTMPHEPSGFEGDAQGAVQLVRADTLLARHNQEDRLQPDVHLDVARLEDGSNFDGERLAARIALVGAYTGALALQWAAAVIDAALRANAAIGPYARLYELVCGLFIVKVWCR